VATAYDTWKRTPEPEPADPSDLVAAKLRDWLDDHDSVAEALDDLAANSDHGASGRYTLFSADLARVLTAPLPDLEKHAVRYFHALRGRLQQHLRDSAEAQVAVDLEEAREGASEAAGLARECAA